MIHLFDGHSVWTPSHKTYAIAVTAGLPVGMASLGLIPGYECLWISDLMIAESHRRKGIATAIVKRLEFEAGTRGTSVCAVGIDERNEPSLRLFRKLGYEEYERSPQDVTVVWMSKSVATIAQMMKGFYDAGVFPVPEGRSMIRNGGTA